LFLLLSLPDKFALVTEAAPIPSEVRAIKVSNTFGLAESITLSPTKHMSCSAAPNKHPFFTGYPAVRYFAIWSDSAGRSSVSLVSAPPPEGYRSTRMAIFLHMPHFSVLGHFYWPADLGSVD
jgi:hypothetical protein